MCISPAYVPPSSKKYFVAFSFERVIEKNKQSNDRIVFVIVPDIGMFALTEMLILKIYS